MRVMQLLRNPEIRVILLIYGVLGIICSVLLYFFAGVSGICIGMVSCLLYMAIYFLATGKRYRQIGDLAFQLDAVLHGSHSSILGDCQEGELAVLRSELDKLVLCMREQAEQLRGEKKLLADALADISHQIKTPMTSIHLLLERFKDTGLSQAERQKMIRELTEFTLRIDWLVYALLKISKLDAGAVELKKVELSVRDLVQEAVKPLEISLDIRGIIWESDIPREVHFLGDPEWSGEAITNILKNCMEYTPRDGKIIVNAEENAIYTRILIRDTGEDIPPEDLPHLFERFYRGSQSSSGGIGIGLSLSQRIIQSQNGTIRVSNHKEGGPLFEIRFYKSVI